MDPETSRGCGKKLKFTDARHLLAHRQRPVVHCGIHRRMAWKAAQMTAGLVSHHRDCAGSAAAKIVDSVEAAAAVVAEACTAGWARSAAVAAEAEAEASTAGSAQSAAAAAAVAVAYKSDSAPNGSGLASL